METWTSGVPQYWVNAAPVASVTKNNKYAIWCSAKHSFSKSTPLCLRSAAPLTTLSIIVPTKAATIAANKTDSHKTVWCALTDDESQSFFRGNQRATERTPRATSAVTMPIATGTPAGAEIAAANTAPIPIRGSDFTSVVEPLGAFSGSRWTFFSLVNIFRLSSWRLSSD